MFDSAPAENVQRVGFLAVVPQLLRSFDVEPGDVLTAAGLDPHALDNPDGTVPFAAMGRLVALVAEKTHCPHVGLLIGQQIGTASLGLVGELMRNAPTLGVALQDLAAHQHRNAHGSIVYLLKNKEHAFFGYAVYEPNFIGHPLICDGAAMAAYNILRELSRPDSAPATEMLFSRSEPLDLAPYRRSFGVTLRFNADQTAVLFPLRVLDRPIAGADAGERIVLERLVAEHWPSGELDIVTQLRRALRIGMLGDQASGHEIATAMGMNRRTLHRRLTARGVNFQQVLSETRYEFAKQLLSGTGLGISAVGHVVGYADPAVFSRAFVRWAGVTPSEWRSELNTIRAMPTDDPPYAATPSAPQPDD